MRLQKIFCMMMSLVFAGLLLKGHDSYGAVSGGDEGNKSLRQAYSASAMDGDLNDFPTPLQSKKDLANAQALSNPANVRGYVAHFVAGPKSTPQQTGNPLVWYRASLAAGQTITLSIADNGVVNDLDLALFDETGKLIDAAIGTGKAETLVVPHNGDYFIRVQAIQGASNYVLKLSDDPLTAAGWRLSDAFVPGDIMVRFADEATSQRPSPQIRAQSLGLAARAGTEGRNMLLSLAGGDRATVYKALGIAHLVEQEDSATDPDQQLKLDTLYAAKALSRRPDVVYAVPNFIRSPQFVPNDPIYSYQWHYPLISLPQAWDVNTGSGTIVAVLDTGVWLSHPDLQGQFVTGYDFVSDPANANDGDGIDPDPTDSGGSYFHGTHVTGTIAAATNNADGVAGIAFGARIMPVRVMGRRGGTDYDIEQGVRFAARLPNDSGTLPPHRADVINLSLGGPDFSSASEAVFQQARAAGVVIVAAAGNEGSSYPIYPASYPGVLSVSAVDINKAPAPYSNFGPFIKVAAPGGNRSTDINGDGQPDGVLSTVAVDVGGSLQPRYDFYAGSSMATAHVSGVVALMLGTNPALTPLDIDNLLVSGALTEDLGQPGRDNRYGYGLINAYRAVVAAADTPGGQPVTPVPILVVVPPAIDFGPESSSLTLTVSNGGGSSLRVNPPSEDSSGWLRITAAVDANGLGDYTLSADRTNLPDGRYSATVTYTSNANTVQVPVSLQVGNNAPSDGIDEIIIIRY